MTRPFRSALAAALLLCTGVGPAGAANLTCPSATTLDALVSCIRGQMPAAASGGFQAPTATEQTDWRAAVRAMLGGTCGFALPSTLASAAQIRVFTDSGNGKTYCLLMEVLDANSDGKVDRGWGTFIVNAAAQRLVSHQAPHPATDQATENEAIGIFRDTDSRSFLMAGAYRSANSVASTCQASYEQADAAHNVATMFHATNAELLAYYGSTPFWTIQWHGMAADTCPAAEVYISHGRDVAPVAGDRIAQLQQAMLARHPAWQVQVPGSGACSQTGTDNTQGRLLNGVVAANVCTTAATSYSGRFLHIEQDPGFRSAADWSAAVIETWPVAVPVPAVPTGLRATGGKKKIALAWNASAGAASYTVKRADSSAGPYAVIASGIPSTSYNNTNLATGGTYWYVVSATNISGQSANSAAASAKVK